MKYLHPAMVVLATLFSCSSSMAEPDGAAPTHGTPVVVKPGAVYPTVAVPNAPIASPNSKIITPNPKTTQQNPQVITRNPQGLATNPPVVTPNPPVVIPNPPVLATNPPLVTASPPVASTPPLPLSPGATIPAEAAQIKHNCVCTQSEADCPVGKCACKPGPRKNGLAKCLQ